MPTFQLTAEERLAAEFYEETAATVLAYGLAYFDREDRMLIRKGKQAVAKLEQAAKASLNRRSKAATEWFPEEYDALAAAYHRHPSDRKAALAEFRCYSDRHSDSAVDMALGSCRFLDTRVQETEGKGLHDYANGLLNALQDIEPGRFKGNR